MPEMRWNARDKYLLGRERMEEMIDLLEKGKHGDVKEFLEDILREMDSAKEEGPPKIVNIAQVKQIIHEIEGFLDTEMDEFGVSDEEWQEMNEDYRMFLKVKKYMEGYGNYDIASFTLWNVLKGVPGLDMDKLLLYSRLLRDGRESEGFRVWKEKKQIQGFLDALESGRENTNG
jgi:polyhydroxyalkanoate synthesis regulator phasin